MNSAIRQVISIANSDLTIIEHQGERVVTLAMVDQVHQRPDGTAGRNFRSNKERFSEGKHFFKINSDEFRRSNPAAAPARGGAEMVLLTQRGYLMLVKSFTDELSWQVQDMLVDGYFEGQRRAAQPVTQRIALSRHRLALAKELHRTRDAALRQTIHQQLDEVSRAMGLPTPALDSIGWAEPEVPDIVAEFWEFYDQINGEKELYNHSCNPARIAFNLPEIAMAAKAHNYDLDLTALRPALRLSRQPRFIEANKAVHSRIDRSEHGGTRTVRCWVFARPSADAV